MTTIPASNLVQVIPEVLAAGGDALVLNGLVLTTSTRIPIGAVQSFPNDGSSVSDFFGAGSHEEAVSEVYFNGFNNSTKKPASILFAQYPKAAVPAYLRGGPVGSQLTLAELQLLTGSLTAVVDGYSHVISSISLASYASFSAAAVGIQAAFTDPTEASFTASLGATFTGTATGTSLVASSVTGIISVGDTITGTGIPANTTIVSGPGGGGAGTYITSQATTASTAAIVATSTVLDVTVCASPTIAVGQTLAGAGVTGTPLITAFISGTGGVGTYRIAGTQQQVAGEAMTGVATVPVVTYDSVSQAFIITSGVTGIPSTAAFATGSLAIPLDLTAATGAVLSQGAAAAVPATYMDGVVGTTQNWATFMTGFNPDDSGNANKLAFAQWTNNQNKRYAYIAWDTDINPTLSDNASSSLGALVKAAGYDGSCCIYEPTDQFIAAFVCGAAASIDFGATNGRITFAYRGQDGLTAGVTTEFAAANLEANGYNFYGAYATAAAQFRLFQPGSVSGEFEWLDSYINQIWFNNAIQLALMDLLVQVNSVPYNQDGYDLIKAACADPVNAALNFGSIRAGVTLSASQKAEVNAAAGTKIDDVLQIQGWYLQVIDADPTVRQARQTPPINLWYTDGESIQKLVVASILVQ